MSRFQRIAVLAVVSTFLMVVIGVIVRSTGSGMGCPDWPLCHGQVIPPAGDTAAWLESIHRWWGVVVGFVMLALVIEAFRSQRAIRALTVGSLAALALTGFQAWLGMITVAHNNSGESVTAHLATAMVLLAVAIFLAVRAGYPAVLPRHGASQRLTLLLAFASISVYALLLFGSHVTALDATLAFRDWPLFDGQLLPGLDASTPTGQAELAQFLHRFVAAIVGVIALVVTIVIWRRVRTAQAGGAAAVPAGSTILGLAGAGLALYGVQIIVGALQIWTTVAAWALTLHLALGAAIWGLFAAATFVAWYAARVAVIETGPGGSGASTQPGGAAKEPSTGSMRDRVAAYVALTKPRIIELLLVTTLPAMVLAWSTVREMDAWHFTWLAVWTLVGGTLAAGAANAVNCYLDRDIDEIMVRTRRRPLPAHQVAPVDALMFGLALTVVSFGLLAVTTNLVASFLTLLAVGFYVVVYTMLLKRTTPQNIVLGGAAGALPPVIGWAAVTGDITLPALLLFAIVFYWTPPHFWALSLRIRGDYAAANVPMLPVTHGVAETTRQIALYSVLMVALTLVFFAVAHMGLLFLAGALALGALFLGQAFLMWREGTDARAIRLYKYSITYLTGLFALIVLDVAVFVPLA
jgi:protoheme IX farnesyltransferase